MAAVRLMIERGDLTEAEVMDGSIFDDCGWADDFSWSNPAVAHVQDDWHRIEWSGGTWGFTAAALAG